MPRTICTTGAILATWLACGAAWANVTLDGQARSVATSSTSNAVMWEQGTNPFFPDFDAPTDVLPFPANDLESAPDFAPFQETASTTDPTIVIVPFAGSATASQDSTLSATLIEGSGSVSIAADAFALDPVTVQQANLFFMPPIPWIYGQGRSDDTGDSSFSVVFTVNALRAYHLTGSLSLSEPVDFDTAPFFFLTTGQATLELRDAMGGVVAGIGLDQGTTCGPPCTVADVEQGGLLQPGTYELVASVDAVANGGCIDVIGLECKGGTASGSFEFELALSTPVPALPSPAHRVLPALLLAAGFVATRRYLVRRPRNS